MIPILDLTVGIVSLLVVYTKYLDCRTTDAGITHIGHEANPLAQRLMRLLGMRRAIWVIWWFTLLVVALSLYLLYTRYDTLVWKAAYVLIGLLVSASQYAVAHHNGTGRANAFTRFLMRRWRV